MYMAGTGCVAGGHSELLTLFIICTHTYSVVTFACRRKNLPTGDVCS